MGEFNVMKKLKLCGPQPALFQKGVGEFLINITKQGAESYYHTKVQEVISTSRVNGIHETIIKQLRVDKEDCVYDIFLLNFVFPSLRCSYCLSNSDYLIMCQNLWHDLEDRGTHITKDIYEKSFWDAYTKTQLFKCVNHMDMDLLPEVFRKPPKIFKKDVNGLCTCGSVCFVCKFCKQLGIQAPSDFGTFIHNYMHICKDASNYIERFSDDMLLQTIHLFLAYIKSYSICENQLSITFMLCHAYIVKGDFDSVDIAIQIDECGTYVEKGVFILLFKKMLNFFYAYKSVPPTHMQKLYEFINKDK